ncbi:MAG: DUF1454 family protein [Symbiopectobacterium sp.]
MGIDSARSAQAIQYMSALLRHFIPSLSEEQSSKKITELLNIGKLRAFTNKRKAYCDM